MILLSDRRVEKAAFVKHHRTGKLEEEYDATFGANITPLMYNTNGGPIKFIVWDTLGQERAGGPRDDYYIEGQCAIMIFDVRSRITLRSLPNWYNDITRNCRNIPIALIGNNVEATDWKVKRREVTFHQKERPGVFGNSMKLMHNLNKPFLWLARELTGDNNLHFVDPPTPFDETNANTNYDNTDFAYALQQKDFDDNDDDKRTRHYWKQSPYAVGLVIVLLWFGM